MRVDIEAQRDSKEKTGKFRHAGLISYLKFFWKHQQKNVVQHDSCTGYTMLVNLTI